MFEEYVSTFEDEEISGIDCKKIIMDEIDNQGNSKKGIISSKKAKGIIEKLNKFYLDDPNPFEGNDKKQKESFRQDILEQGEFFEKNYESFEAFIRPWENKNLNRQITIGPRTGTVVDSGDKEDKEEIVRLKRRPRGSS